MKRELFTIVFLALLTQAFSQSCEELFISEYVEGSANNKSIELYNPSSAAIDLSAYRLVRYSNGNAGPPEQQWMVYLSDTIEPYRTFVIVLDKRDPNGTGQETPAWDDLQDRADVFLCPDYDVSHTMYFNGDDALALETSDGTYIDIFGRIGERPLNENGGTSNPAGGWSTTYPYNTGEGVIITRDHTMFRTYDVDEGIAANPDNFNPMAEYDTLPVNTFTNLNWHESVCMTGGNEKPEFSQSTYEFSILSGSTAGTEVGSVTAIDPDADAVDYFIVGGNPGHPFKIDRNTGLITVDKDEELTTDAYVLTIDATDGTSPVSVNVIVSISQNFEELEFGTDSTLDVVTWNIEHFPKIGTITTGYVAEIIEALEADVVAIQEIEETDAFYEMLESMEHYDGFTMTSNEYINLAFIYNTNWVQMVSIDSITSYKGSDDPFPRKPLILEILFMDETYFFINNHLKAGGDGYLDLSDPEDEETRRHNACVLLEEYIVDELPDENVILLGDLNDDLADSTTNNVFQAFLNQPDDYLFTDMDIARGSPAYWSFPNWPSHLDHLLITSELFDEFENENSEITTLIFDEYFWNGWDDYDYYISDHRPVGLKLMPDISTGITGKHANTHSIVARPNPCSNFTSISLPVISEPSLLEVVDMNGKIVAILSLEEGQSSVVLNTASFNNGIYCLLLRNKGGEFTVRKIIVQH